MIPSLQRAKVEWDCWEHMEVSPQSGSQGDDNIEISVENRDQILYIVSLENLTVPDM